MAEAFTGRRESAAYTAETPNHFPHKVHIGDRDATVDGMYLRIIVHANE